MLLEIAPKGLDLDDVRTHLLGVPGVTDVHDLHAWTITSGIPSLSAHVTVTDECLAERGVGATLDELSECVAEHFDVRHATFQVEPVTPPGARGPRRGALSATGRRSRPPDAPQSTASTGSCAARLWPGSQPAPPPRRGDRTLTTAARGDPDPAVTSKETVHSEPEQRAGHDTLDSDPTSPRSSAPPSRTAAPSSSSCSPPRASASSTPSSTFDFSPTRLRGFYRDMVLTRRIDTEATALQRHGELGIWAQLLGQEAAQIGAGRALRPQDFVFPTYREHGVAWCRGVDPLNLLGLFRGVDQGAWDPDEYNFGLYTIVIGAQTLHATGYAMGMQRDGAVGTGDPDRDAAVIAHFGDGATSQGDVNEAFIFAASYNAPVVFFCQNNQWAISEPIERQTRIPLYQRALGFGFPGVRVDGNDVLATYAVTQAALQRARDGQGPTFVEAYTYRMGAHTTTDDPTRYRLSDDVEHWKLKDPIARVEAYLKRNGLADDDFFDEVERRGRRARRHAARGLQGAARPEAARASSTTSTPSMTDELAAAARRVRGVPRDVRGERTA